MAYCRNCGHQIDDQAVICPFCGVAQGQTNEDTGGFGWGLFGFCMPPLITFILWLIWRDSKPNRAAAICHGAIVGIVIGFLLGLLGGVMGALA